MIIQQTYLLLKVFLFMLQRVSLAGELDVFSRAFHMLKNNFPEKFYTLEGVATTDNEVQSYSYK